MKPVTLKKRSEFLAMRRARRVNRQAFLVQLRSGNGHPGWRVGYTVSKKCGNAVTRNRIRRRLRAAMSALAPLCRDGFDYVIVATKAAATTRYATLRDDLQASLKSGHRLDEKSTGSRKHGPRHKKSATKKTTGQGRLYQSQVL